MASKVEIINLSLARLGTNLIASTDEGSTEATLANVTWDVARRAALSDHPWNFAIKEADLARFTVTDGIEFQYKYALPSDSLRLLDFYPGRDFEVHGRSIYTNEDTCKIKYVYDNTDPATWSALFIDAFAWRLASDLAYAITKSTSQTEQMFGIYEQRIRRARAIDASEDVSDQLGAYDHPFIVSRF